MISATELRDALRCDRPRCACRRARTVHCPNHPDRSPSFVVAEVGDRLLVHCHGGCDQRAVIITLRARQLWPSSIEPSLRKPTLSPLAQARRDILLDARRRLRPVDLERYRDADSIRVCAAVARRARAVATALGESERTWDLLAQAADLEWLTCIAEMRLDEVA